MAYNNRGGYGNRQGGGYQNNRGGGRSGGGGYNRGGNGGGRGGNRGGEDFKYVRSSFFSKHLIFEAEKQGDAPAPREEAPLQPGVTEEITLTLSPQKTEQLMEKLQNAINDQAGDGGVRITMYAQHKINQQDNSEFDGASLLVVAKFPPKNQNGYGGQRGGNGRRDYPDRDANSGTRGSGQNTSGRSTGGTTGDRGGHTQNAQNGASHSDGNYTENNGW